MPVVQLGATSRFYHPAHSGEWNDVQLPARIKACCRCYSKAWNATRTLVQIFAGDIYIVSPRASAAALRIAEILAL